MGHQQSRGNQSTQNINHSKFGKVTFPVSILEKQPQNMEVQLPCDQSGYKKWKQDLKKSQKNLSNMKYLLLPVNHKFSTGGLCSQSGIAKVTYQKLPYILEDQISAVKDKNHTFSEPQIWKLLYVIVSAKNQYLDLMKQTSLNLGNINPKNIFLNEKGSIKISNPLSWPNYIDGYRNALLKQPSYLSPEDMRSLELGASNNDANINSGQFSVGMTLLSAGLTQNLQSLYNFETNTLNKLQFQQKLILWKTTMYYSQILRAVILCLLETDPSKRMNLRQISQFLRPHISNIESQKPLKIFNTTKKIESQIQKLRNQIQGLLKYRFQKYSPQKTRQVNQRSLPKQSRKNSPPKSTINRPGPISNLYSSASMNPQQGHTIARVKSQTKFTYSNKPLENVAPVRFVLENNNQTTISTFQSANNVPPSVAIFIQQNSVSPRASKIVVNQQIKQSSVIQEGFRSAPKEALQTTVRPPAQKKPQIVDEIFPPHNQKVQQIQVKSSQIAQKLVDQGLTHADSEIHTQNPKKQNVQSGIKQLFASNQQSEPQNNKIFQKKQKGNYQTYAEIVIKCDFESAWIEYLAMINRPDLFFPILKEKVTTTDQIIDIPPGKVRLYANKEEGKVQLQNLSTKCYGEILGGVSKYSPDQVQVWFNSSYTFDGKPFPSQLYFAKSLQILKKKLQANK